MCLHPVPGGHDHSVFPERNPFHCIIPPYMRYRAMDQAESIRAFRSDVNNFSLDEQFRGSRQTYTKLSDQAQEALSIDQLKLTGTRNIFYQPARQEAGRPNREVYSANNAYSLPGTLIRDENDPDSGDGEVDRVFGYAGNVYDFYYSIYGRDSINNKGMKMVQTVHYGRNYANAMWDGKQMVYGDASDEIFRSFTSDVDVVGHELTHGVVQFECALRYQDQSGALNESLADVFGVMVKQKLWNQDAKTSNWLIGENILQGDGYALRSFKAPGTAYVNHPVLGTDPQPADMSGYTDDPNDNGGVHLNSGITNRAFYLACVETGGFSWEKVGRVWYQAMCDKTAVRTNATFAQFRDATLKHASAQFGAGNLVTKAIEKAWKEVGVIS